MKCECTETGALSRYSPARVNQHSPMPGLAVLSIGWAAFFHPDSDPARPLAFNLVFFGAQPTHSFNNPIDLATLLT